MPARIADPVPRLGGALPISYTQFPPKSKKNTRQLLSRATGRARTRPRNYFSPGSSLFSGIVQPDRPAARVSVTLGQLAFPDSSPSPPPPSFHPCPSPQERTCEIPPSLPALSVLRALFFAATREKRGHRVPLRDSFTSPLSLSLSPASVVRRSLARLIFMA